MKRMVAMLVLVGTLSAVASADMMDLDLYKKSSNGDEYIAVVYDNDVYTQAQSVLFLGLNLSDYDQSDTGDWTLEDSVSGDLVFDLSNYISEPIPDPVQFSFAGEDYTSDSVYYWGPQSGTHADRMYMFAPVPGDIPEPTTMGLLALGGLAVLRRRRK